MDWYVPSFRDSLGSPLKYLVIPRHSSKLLILHRSQKHPSAQSKWYGEFWPIKLSEGSSLCLGMEVKNQPQPPSFQSKLTWWTLKQLSILAVRQGAKSSHLSDLGSPKTLRYWCLRPFFLGFCFWRLLWLIESPLSDEIILLTAHNFTEESQFSSSGNFCQPF